MHTIFQIAMCYTQENFEKNPMANKKLFPSYMQYYKQEVISKLNFFFSNNFCLETAEGTYMYVIQLFIKTLKNIPGMM